MADPSTWWGTRAASRSVQPVRDPDQPVPVSASVLERVRRSARPSGSSPARPAASPAPTSRPTSARWCTRSPSGSPTGELEVRPRRGVDVADGARRARSGTGWSSARRGPRPASSSGSGPRSAGSSQWHHANPRTPGRRSRQQFRAVLDLPDGEQVRLTGYADRLELDADGSVVVVDLKTGRTKPTDKSVRDQRPARALPARRRPRRRRRARRRARRRRGRRRRAGPARAHGDGGPDAVVQSQPAQAEDGPERDGAARPAGRTAAQLLRAEQFPAVAGQHCRDCASCRSARSRAPGSVVGPVTVQQRRSTPRRPRRGDGRRLGGQRPAVGRDLGAARARGRDRRRRLRQDHADGRPGRLPRADRPGAARRGARPDLHDQGRQRAAQPDPRGAARRRRARSEVGARAARTSSSRRSRPTTPTPPACSPTTACGSATSRTPG